MVGIGWQTMDDLISRAAAIEHMKSMAGCATCDNYNYVRCRACSWNDAMNIVEELPTIDAIPVEWLLKKKASCMRMSSRASQTAWLIGELIKEWQKEQEAR